MKSLFEAAYGTMLNKRTVWQTLQFSALSTLLSSTAFAGDGDLLWQSRISDFEGSRNDARATTVMGNQVITAGIVQNESSGGYDWVVQSRLTSNGWLLWEDRMPAGDNDDAGPEAIVAASPFLVVAGSKQNANGDLDVYVRTYETLFGLTLWSDQYDYRGGDDKVKAIGHRNGQIIVAGQGYDQDNANDWLVRSYSVLGPLLWSHSEDFNGQWDNLEDARIDINGLYFTLVGDTETDQGNQWLVQTREILTGGKVWQDMRNTGGWGGADSVVSLGNRVYVAGSLGYDGPNSPEQNAYIVAYHLSTGGIVWDDEIVGNDGRFADFDQIDVADGYWSDRIVAGGEIADAQGEHRGYLRAYDANGHVRWQDTFRAGSSDQDDIDALTVSGNRVVVAGEPQNAVGPDSGSDWMIRSYDVWNGQLRWQALHDDGGGDEDFDDGDLIDDTYPLAVSGGRVFVCGQAGQAEGSDWLQQTYDL